MKLVVALDLPSPDDNYTLVKKLAEIPDVGPRLCLKVGLNTFIAAGPDFIHRAKAEFPFEVALDLKLFDIPNTMASAVLQMAKLGVDLFTVHATAGAIALSEVRRALRTPDFPSPPKVLAVTVLTSMAPEVASNMYNCDMDEAVRRLVCQALDGSADGVVCSPVDLPHIDGWVAKARERSGPPPKLIKFVPGIELSPRKDDQKRKGTLADVIRGGADYVVVGRPIYQSQDPKAVVEKILTKITRMEQLRADFEAEAQWE